MIYNASQTTFVNENKYLDIDNLYKTTFLFDLWLHCRQYYHPRCILGDSASILA